MRGLVGHVGYSPKNVSWNHAGDCKQVGTVGKMFDVKSSQVGYFGIKTDIKER